jgi:hypothetical protein
MANSTSTWDAQCVKIPMAVEVDYSALVRGNINIQQKTKPDLYNNLPTQ